MIFYDIRIYFIVFDQGPGLRPLSPGLLDYPIADADSATVPIVSSMLAYCFCLLCVVCWSLCVVGGLVVRSQTKSGVECPKV